MQIETTYLKNTILYVEAKGRLDIYSSQDYLDEIKRQLKPTFINELVLEFSEITNIASIGLRAILELQNIMQERGGSLKLKNVNKDVLYVFEITGFNKFLTIENDMDTES